MDNLIGTVYERWVTRLLQRLLCLCSFPCVSSGTTSCLVAIKYQHFFPLLQAASPLTTLRRRRTGDTAYSALLSVLEMGMNYPLFWREFNICLKFVM